MSRPPLLPAPFLDGHMLRPDAAASFWGMSHVYQRETGERLVINYAYRSWVHQLGVKLLLPRVAVWPWQSAHVRGIAVDLQVGGFDSPTYQWLYKNAGRFGWTQPEWAQECGWNPEPWHWEYRTGSGS